MTRRFGIDTSILVRLLPRDPEADFDYCVTKLRALIEQGGEVFASNQVIGETYVAVQHHYGVSKADARASLLDAAAGGGGPRGAWRRSGSAGPARRRTAPPAWDSLTRVGLHGRSVGLTYMNTAI